MYYVEKIAVYGHGVFGIFDDLEDAKKHADYAASKDKDGHHVWKVKGSNPDHEDINYTLESADMCVYETKSSNVKW